MLYISLTKFRRAMLSLLSIRSGLGGKPGLEKED